MVAGMAFLSASSPSMCWLNVKGQFQEVFDLFFHESVSRETLFCQFEFSRTLADIFAKFRFASDQVDAHTFPELKVFSN